MSRRAMRSRAVLVGATVLALLVSAPAAYALWSRTAKASVAVSVGTTATGYLENPGTGNTSSSSPLEFVTTTPTGTLPNYDTNRDASPGLLLAKGSGLGETDATKHQLWSVQGHLRLKGPVTLRLWSAMKGFDTSKSGSVTAGLYRCDPTPHFRDCTNLASSTLAPSGSWSGGSSGWVQKVWSFGTLDVDIPPNRRLYLKIVVNSSSGDDMWFAYDTAAQPSALVIG